jgi:hypothetical protein
MGFGISITQANSQVFDSTAAPGCIVDIISVPANNSSSKSYPSLAGFTIRVGVCAAPGPGAAGQGLYLAVPVVTYSGGYPTVSWSPGAGVSGVYSPTQLLVFAV